MASVKKNVLKVVAQVSLNTAKKACGSASWWDCHQPKEPKMLKKMCK